MPCAPTVGAAPRPRAPPRAPDEARRGRPSAVTSSASTRRSALNEHIDLHTTRFVSGVYARVPETIVYLLILGSMIAIGMVRYERHDRTRRGRC